MTDINAVEKARAKESRRNLEIYIELLLQVYTGYLENRYDLLLGGSPESDFVVEKESAITTFLLGVKE